MTTTTEGTGVTFRLERFEVTGNRLVVEGRWFGVRGLRFVRPSLILHADDGNRSLLALLEHKPWAAEEGLPWTAVFPWDGGKADPRQAELAVAPSVVVSLEPSGRRTPTPHEVLAAEKRKVARLESEVAWLRQEHAEFDERLARATAERNRAVADRDAIAESAERDRVAGAEARSALAAERDAARRERETVARERDDALRERDAARADRVPALAERDAARARTAALAERDAARALALGERSEVRGGADSTLVDMEHRPRSPIVPLGRRAHWGARVLAVAAILVLIAAVIVLLRVV